MSISLQVQVPSHSLSFQVTVPPGATILNLKESIKRECPGQPNVDGQRIICKGRVLSNSEVVEDVWKVLASPYSEIDNN